MDRSRIGGVLICLGTVVVTALYLWGVVARNYVAIVAPVVIAFLGVMALGFWIGWTLAVTETEAPSPAEEKSPGSPDNS